MMDEQPLVDAEPASRMADTSINCHTVDTLK